MEPGICVVRTGTSRLNTRSSGGAVSFAMRSARCSRRARCFASTASAKYRSELSIEKVAVLHRGEIIGRQRVRELGTQRAHCLLVVRRRDIEVTCQEGQEIEQLFRVAL